MEGASILQKINFLACKSPEREYCSVHHILNDTLQSVYSQDVLPLNVSPQLPILSDPDGSRMGQNQGNTLFWGGYCDWDWNFHCYAEVVQLSIYRVRSPR